LFEGDKSALQPINQGIAFEIVFMIFQFELLVAIESISEKSGHFIFEKSGYNNSLRPVSLFTFLTLETGLLTLNAFKTSSLI